MAKTLFFNASEIQDIQPENLESYFSHLATCEHMDALQSQQMVTKGNSLLPSYLRHTDAILVSAIPSAVACNQVLAQVDPAIAAATSSKKLK